MKNSEFIKKLQEYPADMEVAIFDVRQNFYNQDGDAVGIGIHTEFVVEIVDNDSEHASESEKQFLALAFHNDDYTDNGEFNEVSSTEKWKAEKWDKLDDAVSPYYDEDDERYNDESGLITIGEIAASHLGYL